MLIYKKGSLCFNTQFFMDKKKCKEKKKNGKTFDPPPQGFEPRIFEKKIPAQDLNFEGD